MKIWSIIASAFITLCFSYQTLEAQTPERGLTGSSQFYYFNNEVVGLEAKLQRHGVTVNIGISPLFRSTELEVLNVRRNEAISIDYHHYVVDLPEKSVYAGVGYFIKGNLFGQKTEIDEQGGSIINTTRSVTFPFYAIVGEKVAIGQRGFIDMHVRVNEKISPAIFFGLQF